MESEDRPDGWVEKVRANKFQVGMGAFGLILLVVGVGEWAKNKAPSSGVEIIEAEDVEDEEVGGVIIDISGAVVSPGVYELGGEARVGEAIEAAGGLSETADLDWVGQNLNLAQELNDGAKIYLPFAGDPSVLSRQGGGQAGQGGVGLTTTGKVGGGGTININTASESQLDSLWGIGEARASSIVENRPFGSTEELMSKAGIPKNVFERIEDEISVY